MRLILNFFNNICNNRKSLLIFIFLISILCSLIFLIFFKDLGPSDHRLPGTDYFTYYEPMANNILQGKGITVDGVTPRTIALGFPIILSGIFGLSQLTGIDKLDLIVVFNVILTALACCFLFLIAKEIFNKKIALISSFLWMSYPFNLWFLKNPNTEVPFIPLLYIGIWFYILTLNPVRGQRGSVEAQSKQTSNGVKKNSLKFSFLAGIFLGLASATRIIGLFFPLFLAILIFFFLRDIPKKRKFLLAIILLIGNLLAILPWGIYAFSKTGGFVPLSTQGPQSIVVGVTWLSGPGRRVVVSDDVMRLIERVKNEDLSSFSKVFQFFGKELINRPIPFLKLIGLKLTRPWYATSSRWYEGKILAVQILYLVTGLLGLIYIIKTARDKIRDVFFLLSPVFYFWAMAFLNISIMRYLIPVMGLVIIFSAITVNIVIDKLSKKIKHSLLCQS